MRSKEWALGRSTGQKLPSSGFKPSKFKIRIVACGKKTDETFGRTSATDLDTSMTRYIISWAASFSLAFAWLHSMLLMLSSMHLYQLDA